MSSPLLFREEFEVVIMIEVVTEEMHGSACVKKRGKARAVQKMKVGPSVVPRRSASFMLYER